MATKTKTPSAEKPKPPQPVSRCEVCDFPLAKTVEEGCVPGNCGYRPEVGSDEYHRIQKRRAELGTNEQEEEPETEDDTALIEPSAEPLPTPLNDEQRKLLRVGDRVIYRDDAEEVLAVEVRSDPWQLGHGEWVIGLTGISGGYDLNRVIGITSTASSRGPEAPEQPIAPPASTKPAPFTAEELAAYDADTVRKIGYAEGKAKGAEYAYENSKATASEDKKRYEARVDELRKLIHERSDNRGKRPQATLLDQIPAWRSYSTSRLALSFPGAKEAVETLVADGITTLGDLYDQIAPRFDQPTGPAFGLAVEVIEQLRAAVQGEIDGEKPIVPAEAELWREFPIERWSVHGLTAKDIEKLHSGEAKGGGGHPIITVGDLNRFVTPNPSAPSFSRGYSDIKGIGTAGADRISEAETAFWGWWRAGGDVEFAGERGVPTVAGTLDKLTATVGAMIDDAMSEESK